MTDEALAELAGTLERRRCDAMVSGDIAALGALLSEDLRYGHSSGYADDRAAYLAAVSTGHYAYRRAECRIEQVAGLGTEGLMVCGSLTLVGQIGGVEKTMNSIYVANWRREDGVWRFLAHQSARKREA